MTTYVLKGRITEDHRLEVDVPDDAPPGDAEVTLVVEPRGTGALHGNRAAMRAALDEIYARRTPPYRTKAEADALLDEMRNEWDTPRSSQ